MNNCYNCKFVNPQEYGNDECKINYKFNTTNGYYVKVYPTTSTVRGKADSCSHYQHNWFMKLKIRIGYIQGWWYSKKCPEKMI